MKLKLILFGCCFFGSLSYSARIPCPVLVNLVARNLEIDRFPYSSLNAIGRNLPVTLRAFSDEDRAFPIITLLGSHRSGKSVFANQLAGKYFASTSWTVVAGYGNADITGVNGAANTIREHGKGRDGLILIEEGQAADPTLVSAIANHVSGNPSTLAIDGSLVFLLVTAKTPLRGDETPEEVQKHLSAVLGNDAASVLYKQTILFPGGN